MNPGDRVWHERGLFRAVLAGDERAWRQWYEEAFAGLAAYVHWRCAGLRDVSEEIVQETWLTAVRRIRCFDPDKGSFSGWLRGIAANHLHNYFRARRSSKKQAQSLNGHPDIAQPTPEIDPQERAERIAHALAVLPERYEAVLRAKYLEQQSMTQIAEAWQESGKAIESLLTRARQAFREIYAKDEDALAPEKRK